MFLKSPHTNESLAGFVLAIGFSGSANAMQNPIQKAGSASKIVAVKTCKGAKTVAKVHVRLTKDVATGAWDASDRLATRVRSAF